MRHPIYSYWHILHQNIKKNSYVVRDDFLSINPLWKKGDFTPATHLSVSGGKGIITPTLGSEIHVQANAASDPNGNEANATTGWSGATGTLSSDATDPFVGSFCLQHLAVGVNSRNEYTFAGSANELIQVSFSQRQAVGTNGGAGQWANVDAMSSGILLPSTAVWTDNVVVDRLVGSPTIRMYARATLGAAGDIIRHDNTSIKKILEPTAWLVGRIATPVSSVQANFWRSFTTPFGISLFKDINNFILCYKTGNTSFRLVKRVTGIYSAYLASSAAAYVAGAVLKITPNSTFTSFVVNYNGVDIIPSTAIADFSPVGNWYIGIYKPYNSGIIANDAFTGVVVSSV